MTVMKYHGSVNCQESYIFLRDYIFPKCAALRENIVPRENLTILAPLTRDISTVPVYICYIRWSKLMISSKYFVLYMTYTKLGNKTRSLRTKQSERKLDSFVRVLHYDVILLSTGYSVYAVHFFLSQFPNMESMLLLLLSPLFCLLNCYIFVVASLRLL